MKRNLNHFILPCKLVTIAKYKAVDSSLMYKGHSPGAGAIRQVLGAYAENSSRQYV